MGFKRSFNDAICYYQVGNDKTYNKFEAIKWANGDLSKVHFYFLDDVWDSIDMTVEPTETWDQLMRDRCFQLRDNYQTIGISYSGGYDSQTILDYCITNGIRVDEIVVSTLSYWNKDSITWKHPEAHSAPVLAQWYKENVFPDLKISIVARDVDYVLKTYEGNEDDVLFNKSNEMGFIKNGRALHVDNNQVGAVLLSDPTTAIVDGHEKPYLIIKDGWWYTTFPDTVLQFSTNSPYESFYLARELPKLHVKQTHMMINWLESLPSTTVAEVAADLNKCYSKEDVDNWFYYRYNIAVGRTMVRHWNSFDCLSSGKHRKWPNGLYDHNTARFYRTYKDVEGVTETMLRWQYTARNFIKTYSNAFDGDQTKLLWTKAYPIKPVEPGRTIASNIIL
jgi:hypothetical protein